MTTNTSPPPVDVAFLHGVSVFDEVFFRVPAERWDASSPCSGWTARDVLAHVVGTMTKGLAVLSGSKYPEGPSDPGDQVDPVAAWPEVRDRLRETVRTAPLDLEVDTPQGRRTVAEGLRFPAADLAVHAWDIATATRQRLRLPPELLAHLAATCEQVPEEVLRSPGRFGRPTEALPGADETTRLMAWLGRDTAPVS